MIGNVFISACAFLDTTRKCKQSISKEEVGLGLVDRFFSRCMDSKNWKLLYDNASYLQTHVHLQTLVANLQRKNLLNATESEQILKAKENDQIVYLLDLLRDKLAGKSEKMCDALQETNPEVLEKVGIENKSDTPSTSSGPEELNHIVRSYQAILDVSIEPHQHPTQNSLKHSDSQHTAFL